MGRIGIKHTVVCVDCDVRAELTKTEARREHWDLWLGGGRCPKCSEKRAEKRRPAPSPFELPNYRDVVIVACQADGCDHSTSTTQVYADGHFRPGIHWTNNPELVQRSKDSRARRVADPKAKLIPLPLCPGWDQPGRVVRVERHELIQTPPEASP